MRTWSLLLAAILAASCSGGGGSSSALERIGEETSALRLQTHAHGDRIAAMTSMEQIPPEENDHEMMAGELTGDMHHEMEGMDGMQGFCGDSAGPMHDLMEEIEYECEAHHAAMTGAADMPAAHLEEQRHQNAMNDHLDDIDTMRDAMAEAGCGMGNMHD